MANTIGLIKRFIRGSIWYYEEPDDLNQLRASYHDRRMIFKHPWLILSSQENLDNPANPIIIGVPLTSNIERTLQEGDIVRTDLRGNTSRIICGQVSSLDVKYFTTFFAMADETLVKEVEELVATSIGMKTDAMAQEQVENLKEVIMVQNDALNAQAEEIEKLKKQIEELSKVPEPEPVVVEVKPEVVEKAPRAINRKDRLIPVEKYDEFLKDATTLSKTVIIAKYGLSGEKQLKNQLYQIRQKKGIHLKKSKNYHPVEEKEELHAEPEFEVIEDETTNDEDVNDIVDPDELEIEYFGKVGPKNLSRKQISKASTKHASKKHNYHQIKKKII